MNNGEQCETATPNPSDFAPPRFFRYCPLLTRVLKIFPSNDLYDGWVPHGTGISGYIFGHYRIRADNSALPNPHTFQYDYIHSNPDIVFDMNGFALYF